MFSACSENDSISSVLSNIISHDVTAMYHKFVLYVQPVLFGSNWIPGIQPSAWAKKGALAGVPQTLAKLHISLFSFSAGGILLISRKGAERRSKRRHTRWAPDQWKTQTLSTLLKIRKSNDVKLSHHAVVRQCGFLVLPEETFTILCEITVIRSPTELDSSTHTTTPSSAVKDSQLHVTNTLWGKERESAAGRWDHCRSESMLGWTLQVWQYSVTQKKASFIPDSRSADNLKHYGFTCLSWTWDSSHGMINLRYPFFF